MKYHAVVNGNESSYLLCRNRDTESDAAIAAAMGDGEEVADGDVVFEHDEEGGFEIDSLEDVDAAADEAKDVSCHRVGRKKRTDWPDDVKNDPYCVPSADGASFACLACF